MNSTEKILEYASREVDPRQCHRFDPITRGPGLAIIGLIALGVVAVVFMMPALFRKLVSRGRT